MNNLLKSLVVILFSLLLFSCVDSDELKEGIPLNQSYTGIYNLNKNTIFANATLHTSGGSFVKLKDKDRLKCNDKSNSELLGIYSWDFDKKQDLVFEFKKENGTILRNTIKADEMKTIGFASNFTSLSKDSDNTFTWQGDKLRDNEKITISISQDPLSELYELGTKASSEIKITKNDLKIFKKGEAKIQISRSVIFDLDQEDENAGGNKGVITEFTKEIEIK